MNTLQLEDYKHRRMIANPKLQFGQQAQIAIDDIVNQYQLVINSNFSKRQQRLIQELFDDIKQKKKELAHYKKMLSQENIDRLISERRRQKDKERQGLESRWRQCSESYKTLQEEQKRIINQHKENLFDAKKFQQKISEFEVFYKQLHEKISNMQEKQVKFMTETHQVYRSPYKREKTVDFNETIYTQKIKKLNESHTLFFSNKYSLNKQTLSTQIKSSDVLNQLQKTTKYSKPKIKTFNTHYSKFYSHKETQKQNGKDQLFKFLLNSKIKEKIFEIINRQL